MQRYSDCPQILRDFLVYHETIKGQSELTISEYYLDLRMFLRFIKLMRNDMPIRTRLEDIPINDIDVTFLRSITTSDVFDFLCCDGRGKCAVKERAQALGFEFQHRTDDRTKAVADGKVAADTHYHRQLFGDILR